MTRRSNDGPAVSIRKLEDFNFNVTEVILALLLILFSFTTYYIIPWTFTSGRSGLFLTILNLILVLVLIGLTLLARAIINPVAKFFLALVTKLFCTRDKRLMPIIKMNMEAHKSRNVKTAVMYSLAMAYLYFGIAMLKTS